MTNGSHFKNLFGHNSAADCPIDFTEILRIGKQFFFRRISVMGQIPAFYRPLERIFCFIIVWTSASGAFRVVSDIVVC